MSDSMMSDTMYNRLKQGNLTVLPAAGTFYYTIASIVNLPYGEQVVAILAALALFNGVLLNFAHARYEPEYAGDIKLTKEGAIAGLVAQTGFVDPEAKDVLFRAVSVEDRQLPGA